MKLISRQVIDQMAWNATIEMKELTEAWISIKMSENQTWLTPERDLAHSSMRLGSLQNEHVARGFYGCALEL